METLSLLNWKEWLTIVGLVIAIIGIVHGAFTKKRFEATLFFLLFIILGFNLVFLYRSSNYGALRNLADELHQENTELSRSIKKLNTLLEQKRPIQKAPQIESSKEETE